MFKLRYGYLLSGIITGLVILVSSISSLPDGSLHIFYCDVGQGDAAYIQFPDGRDMLVDGGPDNKVIDCLSRHMPFWDRHIDMLAMTHPQKDHMQGLITVLERYSVDYFIRSDIENTTDGFAKLQRTISDKKINVKFIVQGEQIAVDKAELSFLWPSEAQIAKGRSAQELSDMQDAKDKKDVLGVSAGVGDLNDYSLVFTLRYGTFDAIFTGDADDRVEKNYVGIPLGVDEIEVLKVPHHGSRTGMTREFVDWVRPMVAIISVGKNNYGHPSEEAMGLLRSIGSIIHRTDKEGDIEVVSDGTSWQVAP